MKALFLLLSSLLLTFACIQEKDTGIDATSDCAACLESGGTWQVVECTQNCDLQDISCFTDECPPPCEEDCSGCFSERDCIDAGCSWEWEEFGSTCDTEQ